VLISGVDPGRPETIEIFVNSFHCGRAERSGGRFSFSFLPDPLSPGLHLIEIREGPQRVLAARMVEKKGSPA
jgi:hypothetical protein